MSHFTIRKSDENQNFNTFIFRGILCESSDFREIDGYGALKDLTHSKPLSITSRVGIEVRIWKHLLQKRRSRYARVPSRNSDVAPVDNLPSSNTNNNNNSSPNSYSSYDSSNTASSSEYSSCNGYDSAHPADM